MGGLANCSQTPMVVHEGVKIPMNDAAKLEYDRAELLYKTKKYDQAQVSFEKVIKVYARSKVADNAILRRGQILEIKSDSNSALASYYRLISQYSDSDVYDAALRRIGKIQNDKNDFRRASEAFLKIPLEKIPPSDLTSFKIDVVKALDGAGLEKEKLMWLVQYNKLSTQQSDKAEVQNEIVALIDKTTEPRDLKTILSLSVDSFPKSYVTLQLAKIHYQNNEDGAAKSLIQGFLTENPSHKRVPEAHELLKLLDRAVSDVAEKSVGILVPQSGSKKVFGDRVIKAITLAREKFALENPAINEIQFYVQDIGETPDEMNKAYDSLVYEKKVIAIIGPMFFESTQQIANAAHREQVPIISLSASEGVAQLGDHVFRNSLSKSEQANGLAFFAKEILQLNRIAILYPNSSYGTELTQLFTQAFTKKGGEIKVSEIYQEDVSDLTEAVLRLGKITPVETRRSEVCNKKESEERSKLLLIGKKVKACYPPKELPPKIDFEAVFIPDGFNRARQIVPALAYYDLYGLQILGTNLWNSPEIFTGSVGQVLQGAMFLDGFHKSARSESITNFIDLHYKKYGMEPGLLEAYAYDTAGMVLHILLNERPQNYRDFSKALFKIKNFPGISGPISVDSDGDVLHKLIPLVIDNQEIKELQ